MADDSTSLPAPQDRAEPTPQDDLLHPAHQVFFRAGLIACREYMARFVEAESPSIANSIRANWWPALGPDFGPPRKLYFAEMTSGEFGTPAFRVKTAEEVSPTQEALPIALGFLEPAVAAPARGHQKETNDDMHDRMMDRDREATCAWNCTKPYPHDGPCEAVASPRKDK